MPIIGGPGFIFEYQEPETLTQAAPVQNTFYTIGEVMLNARIYDIAVSVAATGESLEVQMLIDGETIGAQAPVAVGAGAAFEAFTIPDAVNLVDEVDLVAQGDTGHVRGKSHLRDGASVEVQVRKTTAAGAGVITGIVTWGQLTPI